eukprot:3744047-Pleurochrysis_carterae.AAC.1
MQVLAYLRVVLASALRVNPNFECAVRASAADPPCHALACLLGEKLHNVRLRATIEAAVKRPAPGRLFTCGGIDINVHRKLLNTAAWLRKMLTARMFEEVKSAREKV